MVPNFSTTIDAATGQTLECAIPDLGDVFRPGSQNAAMRGYIALSRVTAADSLLIAQPFSPVLFRLGPQSHPSLLKKVLLGEVPWQDVKEECLVADRQSKTTSKLKDERWPCASCSKYLSWSLYFAAKTDKDGDPVWGTNYSKYIAKQGCLG